MKNLIAFAPWIALSVLGGQAGLEWLRDREPASTWFEVASLTVADSVEGDPVIMNVSRKIHRPFQADWIATVRKIENGGVVVACTSVGKSNYKPTAVYPTPLTLDWWTFPIECRLPWGRYTLDTVWSITPEGYSPKLVSAQSNTFMVVPK